MKVVEHVAKPIGDVLGRLGQLRRRLLGGGGDGAVDRVLDRRRDDVRIDDRVRVINDTGSGALQVRKCRVDLA